MTTTTGTRRPSLDVLRGALVALLLVVEWAGPGPGFAWLRHSPWSGVRLADVVFPGLLFLVGASAGVSRSRPTGRVARRAVTLVLLGLLMNGWAHPDLSVLRLPGVLQMIGVAGLLATGVVAACRQRVGAVAAVTLALVLAHAAVLSFAPLDCGTGSIEPGCSAAWSLDRAVFDVEHVYHQGALGHDPEGLVNVALGATTLVLLGWLAARALDARRPRMQFAGAVALATGVAVLAYPPMKRVWTPSFTLLLATGSAVALYALAAFDDREARWPQPLRWTLTALGRNALVLYIGQHFVLEAMLATRSGDRSLAVALMDHLGSALAMGLFGLAMWTAIAAVMHAARWYVTV